MICDNVKPINEFYVHDGMKDGHLNKCKDCTKLQSKSRYEILRLNPEFVESERIRAIEKYHRLGYNKLNSFRYIRRPWCKSPKYKGLHKKLKPPKGTEIHHWCYMDDFLEDVIIITKADHRKLHTYLTLDLDKRIFKTETRYLNTKLEHMRFIESLGLKIIK